MPSQSVFEYAILRVVPKVERQEFINVGVILYCKNHDFLAAKISTDQARIKSFAPQVDIKPIEKHLNNIIKTCSDESDYHPFHEWSKSERFNWLTAPSSTIIQASAVHSGLCDSPADALDQLFKMLVL